MIASLTLAVIVHFVNLAGAPSAVVRDAQTEAAAMFRDVGVEVVWADDVSSARYGSSESVRVTLLPYEIGALRGGDRTVLGAATRTDSGSGVAWVFYRRVESESVRNDVAVARILACAMAHEIAHLLQSSPAHADEGVMRAVWRRGDYARAARGLLRFTPADADGFGQSQVHGGEHGGR